MATLTPPPPFTLDPAYYTWFSDSGTFSPASSGFSNITFNLSLCAKVNPKFNLKPTVTVTWMGLISDPVTITPTADSAKWEEWEGFGITCPSDHCFPLVDSKSNPTIDSCGNIIRVRCDCPCNNCGGVLYFEFIPVGELPFEVGKCCFGCADHHFWFKKQYDQADPAKYRFVATFHYNSDVPTNIFEDTSCTGSITPGVWDWRVREYDWVNRVKVFDYWGTNAVWNPGWQNPTSDPGDNQDGTLGNAFCCPACCP